MEHLVTRRRGGKILKIIVFRIFAIIGGAFTLLAIIPLIEDEIKLIKSKKYSTTMGREWNFRKDW